MTLTVNGQFRTISVEPRSTRCEGSSA